MYDNDTLNMLRARLAREEFLRADAEMHYTPITDNDDPRVALMGECNAAMQALTHEELEALLAEWRY